MMKVDVKSKCNSALFIAILTLANAGTIPVRLSNLNSIHRIILLVLNRLLVLLILSKQLLIVVPERHHPAQQPSLRRWQRWQR